MSEKAVASPTEGRLARRVAMLAVAAILVSVIGNLLHWGGTATTGQAAPQSVVLMQPAQVTGNCPDALAIARQAASLTTVIGRAAVQLDLSPSAGCAVTGSPLTAFRRGVRRASLAVNVAPATWASAANASKSAIAPALAHALARLYPFAHIAVAVRTGKGIAVRATVAPRAVAGG